MPKQKTKLLKNRVKKLNPDRVESRLKIQKHGSRGKYIRSKKKKKSQWQQIQEMTGVLNKHMKQYSRAKSRFKRHSRRDAEDAPTDDEWSE